MSSSAAPWYIMSRDRRAALTRLLEALGSTTAGDGGLLEAHATCDAAIAALGDPATLAERAPPEEHARLRAELGDVVRLHALVSAQAHEQHAELRKLVGQVQEERRSFRYYAPQATGGDVCDVTG